MESDWLYSEDRLAFREKCLNLLLNRFGSKLSETGVPIYSTESIYNCAHDWVSQGHKITNGIIKYYETYYHGVKSL